MKAIRTKYHGAGNVRGSRISATDGDNRVTLHYDDAMNSDANHRAAALALARKLNWHGTLVQGSLKDSDVFVWLEPAAVTVVE